VSETSLGHDFAVFLQEIDSPSLYIGKPADTLVELLTTSHWNRDMCDPVGSDFCVDWSTSFSGLTSYCG